VDKGVDEDLDKMNIDMFLKRFDFWVGLKFIY